MSVDHKNGRTVIEDDLMGDDSQNTTTQLSPTQDVRTKIEGATVSVVSTSIIIQQFWPTKAIAWFKLAEAQFESHGIKTDKARLQRTLASITPEMSDQLLVVLDDLPKTNGELKNLLIDRFAASDQDQLNHLLKGKDLGDRKPSEALRKLKALARKDFSDAVIKSLWITKLPKIIRIPLIAHPATALDDLARTADNMHASLTQDSNVIEAVNRPQ